MVWNCHFGLPWVLAGIQVYSVSSIFRILQRTTSTSDIEQNESFAQFNLRGLRVTDKPAAFIERLPSWTTTAVDNNGMKFRCKTWQEHPLSNFFKVLLHSFHVNQCYAQKCILGARNCIRDSSQVFLQMFFAKLSGKHFKEKAGFWKV